MTGKFSVLSSIAEQVFPFLSTLSQRHYHCHQSAWPWPVACPSWSQLVLALLDMEEASGSLSQMPPLQPCCCQNLATQTNAAVTRLTSYVPPARSNHDQFDPGFTCNSHQPEPYENSLSVIEVLVYSFHFLT